jgi:Tfp pilus assembly protein PilX
MMSKTQFEAEGCKPLSASRLSTGPVSSSESGMVTAVALLILAVLSLVGLAVLDLSFRDVQVSANLNSAAQALHAAEAGIENAYRQIKIATALKANPGQNADGSITLTPPVIANHTFTTLTAVPLFFDAVITTQPATQAQTIASGTLAGLNSFAQNYLVTSEVTGPNGSRAKVVQVLQMGFAPLFQFAVYYNEILEIFPGQTFTITGRGHSNNHIYIGNSTTQVDSFLTSAQNIYRYRLNDGSTPASAKIKDAGGTYRDFIKDHTAADWNTWAINTYNGRVRDSAIGGTSLSLPLDASIQPHDIIEKGQVSDVGTPLATERMYWKADYRILVDGAGAVTVKTGPPGSETTTALDASSFLTTNTNFYDKREGKCMQAAQVDVGALRTAAGWNFTKGNLYVSSAKADTGTCGTGTPNAPRTPVVRLTNGSQLPSSTEGGFTVVTDRPIYVQGSYNTLSTSGVAHNGNDATTPPASVMADAVTVLSNNWGTNGSDTKGNEVVGNRHATDTTIYAGMISGIKPTVAGVSYSGGLENYFRLLEDWSWSNPDKTLTYRGSMVMLYPSEVATGVWQSTGNYYQAPIRDWAFDTLFKDKPPPGTPTLHVPQRVGWWHQE